MDDPGPHSPLLERRRRRSRRWRRRPHGVGGRLHLQRPPHPRLPPRRRPPRRLPPLRPPRPRLAARLRHGRRRGHRRPPRLHPPLGARPLRRPRHRHAGPIPRRLLRLHGRRGAAAAVAHAAAPLLHRRVLLPRGRPPLQAARCQQQRVMVEQNVGFFCHGGDNNAAGDFTVADINMHKGGRAVELCVLNHYHHAPDCPQQQPQWKVDILEMQQQPNQNENHHLRRWWTDAVLPLHDSYLACVDCYHGIILIDVKNQLYFNYIPLPVEAMNGRRVDKYSPDPARSASINSAGNITVVCIADDNAAAGGRNNNSSAGSAFIESWSLVDIHKSRWVLDFTMEASKFWDICSAANQPLLPHAPPAFPLVSMANPFAISFLLYDKANNFLLEDKGNGLYWMIEVDMRNQALLSPATLYISEEEEELFINGQEEEQERCCDERYPPMKYFHGHNFIPSWLPSYLKGGDTTSRMRSLMMQQAKQESAIEKIGRENMQKEKQERAMQNNGLETGSNSWELSKMKGKQQMAMESSGMDAHLSRPLAGLKIA